MRGVIIMTSQSTISVPERTMQSLAKSCWYIILHFLLPPTYTVSSIYVSWSA